MRRAVTAVLIGGIRTYQVLFSWMFRGVCRFEPSCSRYAEEAIRVHGPVRGSWLAARRLARCRPGGGMGYDPVPEPRSRP
jgi:putative membrane protein insertion efficiency factor